MWCENMGFAVEEAIVRRHVHVVSPGPHLDDGTIIVPNCMRKLEVQLFCYSKSTVRCDSRALQPAAPPFM